MRTTIRVGTKHNSHRTLVVAIILMALMLVGPIAGAQLGQAVGGRVGNVRLTSGVASTSQTVPFLAGDRP